MLIARAWAGDAPAGLDDAADDAALLGVPDAAVAALRAQPTHVECWAENAPIVDAFLTVATQWRAVPLHDGRVHYLGLDHGACAASFGLAGIVMTAATWAGLRVMEIAARAALNGVSGADR